MDLVSVSMELATLQVFVLLIHVPGWYAHQTNLVSMESVNALQVSSEILQGRVLMLVKPSNAELTSFVRMEHVSVIQVILEQTVPVNQSLTVLEWCARPTRGAKMVFVFVIPVLKMVLVVLL